jgi:hypothetical protein
VKRCERFILFFIRIIHHHSFGKVKKSEEERERRKAQAQRKRVKESIWKVPYRKQEHSHLSLSLEGGERERSERLSSLRQRRL